MGHQRAPSNYGSVFCIRLQRTVLLRVAAMPKTGARDPRLGILAERGGIKVSRNYGDSAEFAIEPADPFNAPNALSWPFFSRPTQRQKPEVRKHHKSCHYKSMIYSRTFQAAGWRHCLPGGNNLLRATRRPKFKRPCSFCVLDTANYVLCGKLGSCVLLRVDGSIATSSWPINHSIQDYFNAGGMFNTWIPVSWAVALHK